MNYLLDISVISEIRKEVSDSVREWFLAQNPESFFISVITIGEIIDGIERLPPSKKKKDLEEWFFRDVLARFQGKILPINENVAKSWGSLSAELRKKGISIGVQDLYLAATAKVHSLTMLTINVKHFQPCGLQVINPWKYP